MEKSINICVGSLVRVNRGQACLLVRVEKTAVRKSLGRVHQIPEDSADHKFNLGDVITFLNSEVIEVLEFGHLERLLELAVEAFTLDCEIRQRDAKKHNRDQ